MSIAALNWAWNQTAPTSTAKLVLVALADHANGEGECYPSMSRVADLAQCSTRQVSRCVDSLEAVGLVTRRRRRLTRGRLGSYLYQLPIAQEQLPDPDDQTTPTSSGHARPVDNDDQLTPTTPTTGHPRPSPPDTHVRSEPSVEPPPEPKPSMSPDFIEDFWERYPKRDNKRLGKKQARDQWAKLSVEDRNLAVAAVENFRTAAEDPDVFCPIKDPWRWLRDRLFDDWQEPAIPKSRDGPSRPSIEDEWAGVETGRLNLSEVT